MSDQSTIMTCRYQIVRRVVSKSLCGEVAYELKTAKIMEYHEWYEQLEPTDACYQLSTTLAKVRAQHFHEVIHS